jgi:hypothetical protein
MLSSWSATSCRRSFCSADSASAASVTVITDLSMMCDYRSGSDLRTSRKLKNELVRINGGSSVWTFKEGATGSTIPY